MWLSRISLLLEEPPAFLALAADSDDERVYSGTYLRVDGTPYALGRRIARGDEAIVFELVELRVGYCAGVVKICRYKPGTERYARWAVTRRDERNPYSQVPDVELQPARLLPVPGGVVKLQPYLTPDPDRAWSTPAPIAGVLERLEQGRAEDALALAELLLSREGRHAVLLEARGLALERLGRLDEARDALEDALEAHLGEGNAGRLHASYVLAGVLHALYERSAGVGGATFSIELPDGQTLTQTVFDSAEAAAADDTLEDRAVFVLLEALADERYFAGGLLRLGAYIANAPAGAEAIRAIAAALQRIDPQDPDVVAFAAFVREQYAETHQPPVEPADATDEDDVPAAVRETLERFDELYRPEPTRARQAEARHDAALVHAAAGRLDEAERELRDAVALDPDDVVHRLALADALEAQAASDEAKDVLEEATRRFPDDARTYEALGDLHADREQHADAKLAYLRALAMQPDDAWRLEVKVGKAYRALGERERALEFLRTAHGHAPDEPAATVALVEALRGPALDAAAPEDHEGFREAFAIIDAAVRRSPQAAPLQVCLAQSLLALARYDEARAALRRAEELDPDHPFAGRFLSELEAYLDGR